MPPKKAATTPESRKRKVDIKDRTEGKVEDVATKEPCKVNSMFNTIEKKGMVYLDPESFPSYIQDDIWAILQDCGFEYQTGFKCAELNIKGMDHEHNIRKHLCVHGLPSTKDVDEDDVVALKKWVAFANVPLKESDATHVLERVPLPSDYDAVTLLTQLGFNVDGKAKTIYRTHAEESTIAVFKSISDLRTFIRSASDEILLSAIAADEKFSPRKRTRRGARTSGVPLTADQGLQRRLWGALSPTDLHYFGKAPNKEKEEEEGSSFGQSLVSQCIIL